MKVIIIGGVAGGMSAATRLRRNREDAEIVVLERGQNVSFANCGLPYHIGGFIEDRESLLLNSPTSLAARFRLDVRVGAEVVGVHTAAKFVTVRDRATGVTTTESYDSLVISTGASALKPTFASDLPLRTLRDLDDLDAIMADLPPVGEGGNALVVGAGFVGLEAVENLRERGMTVTLVSRGPQVLSSFDPEMAVLVLEQLRASGATVHLDATVDRIEGGAAHLSDGTAIPTSFVFAAVGVRPESALAVEAGIAVGPDGGIRVDEQQRTSADGVFAVGDVAQKKGWVSSEEATVPFAGLANKEGRLAADVIAGIARPYRAALGTAIVESCGIVAARTGRSETELRAGGRAARVIHTHPSNHATYYPGATMLSIKLLVDPEDDSILGAQVVGHEGVDKRIDVIATAMAGGMTASSLAELELAYAPQFGSAKDPVNMLGYIDGNMARGEDPTLQWHELDERLAEGWMLLDVRMPGQLKEGSIPGSLHVSLPELRANLEQLRGRQVVVHCRVGQNSHNAQRILLQNGIEAVNLDGGFLTWRDGMATRVGSKIAG
ncbi:FAD-dependent oxidoreductase [Glaciihabitans sp. dw_435]|uniref:FAD-dependent oxidoreductase n=1 Tax=Glaciihabitans sp. dw_435 TaxID=2720081 RepID=UPI001BD3AA5C|nr:FAD-dependent oxidoreductase [Glaciihabitans sp. dw_435]